MGEEGDIRFDGSRYKTFGKGILTTRSPGLLPVCNRALHRITGNYPDPVGVGPTSGPAQSGSWVFNVETSIRRADFIVHKNHRLSRKLELLQR